MEKLFETGPVNLDRLMLDSIITGDLRPNQWPTTTVPHAGEIRMPPLVAQRPRDKRGYPLLFTLKADGSRYQFLGIHPLKIQQCAKERLCGICGEGLWEANGMDIVRPQRIYFVGGPVSCERTFVFSDPPMHFCCAMFALRVCPWMILARYNRPSEMPGAPEMFNSPGHLSEGRPPKLGLLQATNYEMDEEEGLLFFARFPKLLGYVAPGGWPSDEEMARYWRRTTHEMVTNMTNEIIARTISRHQRLAQKRANQTATSVQAHTYSKGKNGE